MSITVIDNSKKVDDEMKKKIALALEAIGLTAEGYAKRDSPVDTGRLRNSITHAVKDDSAYIGTNVEYAIYQELGSSKTPAKHFLGNAATQHNDEYKELAKNILKKD